MIVIDKICYNNSKAKIRKYKTKINIHNFDVDYMHNQ